MTQYLIQATSSAFDPLDPGSHQYRIKDAVAALSKVCRFNGHVKRFYSVAEHMVLASAIAEGLGFSRQVQRWALMHDLAEAYTQDIIHPLKQLMRDTAPLYMARINSIEVAVEQAFDFEITEEVKAADLGALAAEYAGLITPSCPEMWADLPPLPPELQFPPLELGLPPALAEARWHTRYADLLTN